jgi:hypothetical protein
VAYYSAPNSANLTGSLHRDPGRSRPAVDAATKLTPGAGLTLSLLLSLGLWAAIWQAVSSLAAAWLR